MVVYHGGILPKKLIRRCSCFLLVLTIIITLAYPMIVYATGETEGGNQTKSVGITFYVTTIGGGIFGSEEFYFEVIRVADQKGTAFTGVDDTVVLNGDDIAVDAVPNEAAKRGTFTIENLTAPPNGQARYYYQVTEKKDTGNWVYDERSFVVQILIVDIDGELIAPGKAQEWYYKGVSFDAKGGADPYPSNHCNTFVNEYIGENEPLGSLIIEKKNFNETPAFPDEKFEFQLRRLTGSGGGGGGGSGSEAGGGSSNGYDPVDLTEPGITIHKTDGNGKYTVLNLSAGKFSLTYDTRIRIAGLPAGEYSVEESGAGYEIRYAIDDGIDVAESIAYVPVASGESSTVVFTNTWNDPDTSLTIRKDLRGDYKSWGVNDATVFRVKIKDGRGRYLAFGGTAPKYSYIGPGAAGSEIRFSKGQPAVITGIPIGATYSVEEIIPVGAHFANTTDAPGMNVIIPGGDNKSAEVTIVNTYDNHSVGNVVISKELAGTPGDWGVDDNTVFTAMVKDVQDPNDEYYLHFKRLSDGNYEAVETGTGSPYVQFTPGKPVVLYMIWDHHEYEVEEIAGPHYKAEYTGNKTMLSGGGCMNVTITNTYDHGAGNLVISKRLAGSPGDWGVDENTVFQAIIKDVTDGNYVLFALQPDGKYLAIGNNNSQSPTYNTRELVKFTAGAPVILSGLWPNHIYEVQEIGTRGNEIFPIPAAADSINHYTAKYTGNSVVLPNTGNMNVTITNTYEHGEGNLVLKKTLDGFPGDWGVDENTVFYVRVKDVTDESYLLFDPPAKDGTYRAIGNTGSTNKTNDPRALVQLTASKPVVLTGLWVNDVFEVEEIGGLNYKTTYQGQEVPQQQSLPEGGNINLSIINTYDHGVGNITISKYLAGRPGDWGVDNNTKFTAKVMDVTDANNKYDIYFKRISTGWYEAVDSSMSPSVDGTNEILITATGPVTLAGMWENRRYEVVESYGEGYTTSYTGNGAILSGSGNLNVSVTNTFGNDIGRLKITKANFISTPAKPYERFEFRISRNGNPVNLAADGIVIRKTGGSGEYNAVDTAAGSFSLTYDTEITIFGIPEGDYTIIEEVSWYKTSYVVTGGSGATSSSSGTEAAVGIIGGKETAVTFTNTEVSTPQKERKPEITIGGKLVRLRITKANFIKTPAKPHEAFIFVVTLDGKPVDLTAGDILIRKTGGSGVYEAADLKSGRFTLTYDTSVVIDGLPLGTYSVSEDVTGYITTYTVFDNTGFFTGDEAVMSDITIVFTNEEVPAIAPSDAPVMQRADGSANEAGDGAGPDVDDSSAISMDSPGLGSSSLYDDEAQVKNPKTGDSDEVSTILLLLATAVIGAITLCYFRFRQARGDRRKGAMK